MNIKIKEKINVDDSMNRKHKTLAKGKVVVKNSLTGEILAVRDNLIVNGGRDYIKSLIADPNDLSTPNIKNYKDFIGYFKIGAAETAFTNAIQTVLEDNNLKREIPFSINTSDLTTGEGSIEGEVLSKLNFNGPYGTEYYIFDNVRGTIIGKCPKDIKGANIEVGTSDFILYELNITPYDINQDVPTTMYINELGLFLLRYTDNGAIKDLNYPKIFKDVAEETMFSRVTFDRIEMDGLTEYTVEYYVYI